MNAPRDIDQKILAIYPFTISGTILLVLALILLLRGFVLQNPYALVLSIVALLVLIPLAFLGRLQAIRFGRIPIHWDTNPPLFARKSGLCHRLHAEGFKTWAFFRFHYQVFGRMQVGNQASLYLSRSIALVQVDDHPLPLYFPLCGTWAARSRYTIRDIFGLTRTEISLTPIRLLTVHPGPLEHLSTHTIEPALGYEEKSRKKSSEEEKYYMREYMPGDRLRDINWKASSRLAELITRVSPVTQEKTKQISIDFRHFWKTQRETTESIAHLNALKSWLLAFLRKNKQEHPEYQFRIRTAKWIHELDSGEDIQQFGEALSSLFFQEDPHTMSPLSVAGELFIFSTVFDESLSASALPRAKIHLFITAYGEAEALPLFKNEALPLIPGPWVLRRADRLYCPPHLGWADVEQLPVKVRVI